MGLIDGVYAIAMTLIAIELPTLISELLTLDQKNVSTEFVAWLIGYEFIAYTATFMMLYELWTVHKSILTQGGLTRHFQNLINGGILSLTCLGAGNIILLLKEKTGQAVTSIVANTTLAQLMHNWVNTYSFFSLANFLLIAIMYLLMSLLGSTSKAHRTSKDLRHLTRSLRHRSLFFLICSTLWIPILFGGSLAFPPAILILIFLFFNFNQHYFSALINHWKLHS